MSPLTVAVVALVVAAGLAWLVWVATVHSTPPVSAEVRGFVVESEDMTSVTIDVLRREGDAVRCEVYAEATDHAVVGERTFELPAGAPGTVTIERSIPTEREAVLAGLRGCEVIADR